MDTYSENPTSSPSAQVFAVNGGKELAGVRFADDPLASVSAQFPLTPSGFTVPERSESPSGPETRPFGLRWLVAMGVPTTPTSYRYCPSRQVAVDATGVPLPPRLAQEWTTIQQKDGDEGPSKDYGWETVPDFTG